MAPLFHHLTDAEVLAEIGRRIRRARLRSNLPQRDLAAESGVGERTLRALEAGEDVQVSTLIRVLRALGRLDGLDALLPEPLVSPMERLRAAQHLSPTERRRIAGRERQRAARRAHGNRRGG